MGAFKPFRFPLPLLTLLPLLLGATGGCSLLDQRSFDPEAGKPPQPYIPPAPAAPPRKAPFLQIISGTPDSEYGPVVDKAAKVALSRKANILFVIQAMAPMQATPEEQSATLARLVAEEAVPIAERIVAAGALPIQIEMHAVTDPTLKHALIRVNVR